MGEQVAAFLAVRAAIVPALAFLLGVALPAERPSVALGGAVLAALGWALLARRKLPGGLLLLFTGFSLVGSALAGIRGVSGQVPLGHDGEPVLLSGRITAVAAGHAELDVDGFAPGPGLPLEPARLHVALSGAPADLLVGEQVLGLARLFVSRPPANPGEPDGLQRDRARAVDAHAVVRLGELLRLGGASAWQRAAARLRARFEALAEEVIPAPQPRALVVTLAVGDRRGVSPELNEQFNASGLAHILSVSGLHIAVVALGLLAVLRALLVRLTWVALRTDVRRLAGLCALPAIWAYVALTGAEVPAVRSGIMASALIAARVLGREPEPFTALAWAAVACLALDPTSLHDVSFQLSFVAVLGLMTLAGPLRALVPLARPPPGARGPRAWLARLVEAAVSGCCTSLAASLSTAPIVAATFHRESLVAVLANLVALPVASALTAACALAAAFTPCAPVARLLLHGAGPLASLLDGVAAWFGALPQAQLRVASPALPTTLIFYGALAALALWRIDRRALRLGVLCGAALLGLGAWRTAAPRMDRTLRVTFLSVGQGDATVVRFPGGATLLVDGGGEVGSRFDPGGQIIAPFLWEQGIRRLDAVALSHPHPDHALGLLGLAPLIPADALWLASDHAPGGLLLQLQQALHVGEPGGAALRLLSRGDSLPVWGGARVEVLGPAPGARFEKVNDQSLVLKIVYGEVSVLLPGDAEAQAEAALLAHPEALASTILKAPHHGSKTSSSSGFVEAVHPRYVVFCVGLGNRFHFPAPSVDARYAAAGCQRFRTDQDGAVTFRTDGHTVAVERFLDGAQLPNLR